MKNSIFVIKPYRWKGLWVFDDPAEELERNSGLPGYTLIEVGNDHRLAEPEPLERMLRTCEG
jgi:hypothetical protein